MKSAKAKDIQGQVFGKWTVLEPCQRPAWRRTAGQFWLAQCQCGAKLEIPGAHLRAGRTSACEKCSGHRHATGEGMSPTYQSWRAMRGRCHDPRNNAFRFYGGRGITICSRWDDFSAFLADMGPRPLGASLDRIDFDGNYTPENCRWADVRTQARNSRHFRLADEQVAAIHRLIAIGGSHADIAQACGVSVGHIGNIARGHARKDVALASTDATMKEAMREHESTGQMADQIRR